MKEEYELKEENQHGLVVCMTCKEGREEGREDIESGWGGGLIPLNWSVSPRMPLN